MPTIKEMLDNRASAISRGVCVSCGTHARDFTDQISVHEYRMSGLCQTCQDKVFNVCQECNSPVEYGTELCDECLA